MRDVFGSRNWVYWWAALTTTVFLRLQVLPAIEAFFRDNGFFSPFNFPFSLVSGLNAWLDQLALGIETAVQFNPNAPLISSPVTVPNWILAVVIGLLVMGGAVAMYVRALKSSALGDDIITLFALYFILRIEGYIIGFTNVGPLEGAGNLLTQNPLAGFWILMVALFVLVFIGGGVSSRRAFWRGLLEATLIALFLLPTQTAGILAEVFRTLTAFGTTLSTNLFFGVAWGIIGAILALSRLTSTQAA
jgi:hypothetical protein